LDDINLLDGLSNLMEYFKFIKKDNKEEKYNNVLKDFRYQEE